MIKLYHTRIQDQPMAVDCLPYLKESERRRLEAASPLTAKRRWALLYMIFREAAGGIRRETESPSGGNGLSPQMKSLVLRAVLMTVWLLYSGWRNPVINQAAHVGGLLCGFLFAAVLMPKGKRDLSVLIR